MSDPFDIKQYRQREAEKYARYLAQQEEEMKIEEEKIRLEEEKKRIEEEKIRIENEANLLREMKFREEFDMFLNQLDIIIDGLTIANSILEIDINIICFINVIENGKTFIDTPNFKQEIIDKVMHMINIVTQNENSKFNVTQKDGNVDAANRISDNIKLCLKLIGCDEHNVSFELMDTHEDEEFAHKIQMDFYNENNIGSHNSYEEYNSLNDLDEFDDEIKYY